MIWKILPEAVRLEVLKYIISKTNLYLQGCNKTSKYNEPQPFNHLGGYWFKKQICSSSFFTLDYEMKIQHENGTIVYHPCSQNRSNDLTAAAAGAVFCIKRPQCLQGEVSSQMEPNTHHRATVG